MPALLHLRRHTETPPDQFRYIFSQDGHRVEAVGYDTWLQEIKKHYLDNDYPLPENWIALAEDQLCRSLSGGWCQYPDGTAPATFINRRLSLDDAIHGTKVLAEFVRQGSPIVAPEVAAARAKTCAACYALVALPGCGPCVGFANLVADVCGARTTPSDPVLENKVCGVCHCTARGNVWIPIEVSRAGLTPEMLTNFPEHCWKRREVEGGNNE